jgi:hypothetical protein
VVNIHYGSDKLPAARGFFYAFSKEPVKNPPPLYRHSKTWQQKSHPFEVA